MFGLTLKVASPLSTYGRAHIAPEGQSRALCGVQVCLTTDGSVNWRFGVADATLCTRCRNTVLKAEDDCIYLGYDEKTVEPYLLNRYYVRNTHLAKPAWIEQWAQNMASRVNV